MMNLHGLSWRSLLISSLIIAGGTTLNSCGARSVDTAQSADRVSSAESAAPKPSTNNGSDSLGKGNFAKNQVTGTKTIVPAPQKPQLVKTAELSLRLESIDRAMVQLRQIVRNQQGDIYDFQDEKPQDSGGHRQTTLTLKVPSPALDVTLAGIVKLGQVESQRIKSDDVTQQLVDTDARLKNLRQQEDLTRKIMDRSGSIKDILAVSTELSAIREQIEQLEATVKNLRQQVAYSTINLKLAESQSTTPSGDAFGIQVGETWKNSTRSAGSLGTNLVLGLLWLVPFTPFMAIGFGGVYYAIRKRRQQVAVVNNPTSEEE